MLKLHLALALCLGTAVAQRGRGGGRGGGGGDSPDVQSLYGQCQYILILSYFDMYYLANLGALLRTGRPWLATVVQARVP
jgi:hypothetical protein